MLRIPNALKRFKREVVRKKQRNGRLLIEEIWMAKMMPA